MNCNYITEIIVCLVVCASFHRLRDSCMRWLAPFLLFVFLGEVTAGYIDPRYNTQVYYLIDIAESLFYSYLFYNLSRNRFLQTGIVVLGIPNVLAHICGLIWFGSDTSFYIPLLIAGGFYFALISMLYLCERFNSDAADLQTEPGFWIALGVAVFFSGSSFVFSLYDYIVKENLTLFGMKLYHIVPQALSVFLYGCICRAVIPYRDMAEKSPVRKNSLKHAGR